MSEERRKFLKVLTGAGVVGISTLVGAKHGSAAEGTSVATLTNGVVAGSSPKKEILYKKTAQWDIYYKSSY